MPKKKVAKVKKAKSGKGKKEGKQETKAESDIEKVKANAALWELRLQVTEQSLAQYREACRKLGSANEDLTSQLYRAEKDSVDTTAFLKRQDAAKDEQVEDYTLEINEMKELFRKKSSDFDMIQDGMKKMKDFEKRKAQMEQELNDIREGMAIAEKKHRENLNEMEYTFFKEKARLEKEAEQTIALVVEKAHNEAVVQLDDAARSVFKENVRLNESLKYHIKEAGDLQKLKNSLAEENASLTLDKNTLEMMAKKNTAQMEAQKEVISKLKSKVASLEQALERKTEEPDSVEEKTLICNQASQVELEKLQRVVSMRERELGHIKRLARTIVQQRTELEQFFHEALDQVKQEITASRQQYKKEALKAYRQKLREATSGKLKFPPIRTFHQSPQSTNSVYADMEAAAKWVHQPGSKVEISDLTWEQKEQVLRLLFAKMNGQKASSNMAFHHEVLYLSATLHFPDRKTRQSLPFTSSSSCEKNLDSDAAGIREELSTTTFITQAPELVLPSNPTSMPDIHTT
ncbi:basal body-orientation factor 1 [Aulostomus maculatus]